MTNSSNHQVITQMLEALNALASAIPHLPESVESAASSGPIPLFDRHSLLQQLELASAAGCEALGLPVQASAAIKSGSILVRIHQGAHRYAEVITNSSELMIRLEPGHSDFDSLMATAAEWRKQAARYARHALSAEAAASQLRHQVDR